MKNKYSRTPEGKIKTAMKLQCKEYFTHFKNTSTLENAELLADKLAESNNVDFICAYDVAQKFVNYQGNEHWHNADDLK